MKIENADIYEASPDIDVFSWSPTPQSEVDAGKPQAPSTQVHLFFKLGIGKVMLRFKGPGTLDSLIGALIKHRLDVWGAPQDPDTWLAK